MDLHRRARMDADLALDRLDRPRRPARRPPLLQVALRLPDRPGLVDPLHERRVLGDQVPERVHHAARRDPDLPARANARDQARRGGRRRRLGRRARDGLCDIDRHRRPRLPLLRALLLALGASAQGGQAPRRDHRRRLPRRRLLHPAAAVHDAPDRIRDRGGRPLVHGAARQGSPPQLDDERQARCAGARDRRRDALQPLRAAAHPGVAGADAVLQEPPGRLRPPRRASRSRSASASCR